MANKLQIKRGLVASIPTGSAGEPLFTTDTNDLYIGTGSANIRFQKYIASGATTQILLGDGSLYSFPLAISSPSNGQYLTFNGTSWVNTTLTASGITTLNTLTATTQTFAVGTSGTDFNISSATSTHTFNIPDAGPSSRGLITNSTQTIAGAKTFSGSSITINNLLNIEQYAQLQKLTLSSGSPSSGKGYIWYNSATNTLYFRNDANVNYDLTANSGGTVTSVAMSVPTGFAVTGTPITSSGTLALSFASGYSLPTTASQANWDAAYNDKINSAAVTGTTTKTLTLTQQDGGTITASWTDDNTGTVTGSGTSGYVAYWNGTSSITGESNLFWDATNNRLGINKSNPAFSLDVSGIIYSNNQIVAASAITSNYGFYVDRAGSDTFSSGAYLQLSSIGILQANASNGIDLWINDTTWQRKITVATSGATTITNLAGTGTRMVVADANGLLSTQAVPSGTVTGTGTSGQIAYWNGSSSITGESTLFWDATNDKLGVGTASPNEKLSLYGGTSTTFGISLEPVGWNGSKHRFVVPSSGDTSMLSYNYNGSVVDSSLYATSALYITQGAITFATGTTNTVPTERMRLTSGGNLLVGTSVDSGYKVDILGTARISNTGEASLNLRNYAVGGKNWKLNSYSDGKLYIGVDGVSNDLIIDNGNLGLGVQPSAWGSTWKTLEGEFGQSLFHSNSALSTGIASNAYHNGTSWIYKTAANAAYRYETGNVGHAWYIAASGLGGNPITFTQAMTLDASGRLGIGTASPSYRLVVSKAGAEGIEFDAGTIIAGKNYIINYNRSTNAYTDFQIDANTIIFGTGSAGTERARITSNGRFLLGTATESTYLLDVNGTGRFSGSVDFIGESIMDGNNWYLKTTAVNTDLAINYNGKSTASLIFYSGVNERFKVTSAGAATFSSSVTANGQIIMAYGGTPRLLLRDTDAGAGNVGILFREDTNDKWTIASVSGNLQFFNEATASNAMYITSGNNVGIGTSSPSAKLHIGESGSAAQLWLQRTDGYNPIKLIGGTLADGNGFKITMNTTDAFAITSGGNVGIGTSSPVGKLYINGSDTTTIGDRATATLVLNNINGTALNRINSILLGGETSTTYSSAYVGFVYTSGIGNGYGDLIFGTRSVTTDSAPTERLRIKSTGQLQFNNYQSTTSFTGTVVGYLAFDASGNVLTTAAPGGSGTVTSVATSAPLTGGTITTSGTIGITQSTTSTDGYLSSTDWNTFNGKFTLPSLTSGSVLFSNGTTISQDNSNFFWDNTNKNLLLGTTTSGRTLTVFSSTQDDHILVAGTAPSVAMTDTVTGATYQAKFGLATASNQFASGSVAGDFVISCQTGAIIWALNSVQKMQLKTTSQLQLHGYTSSSSFSGTAAGYLAFDSSGNVITVSVPSSGGITTLNTLTATTQTFAVGTTGTDFNISSATSTHTFNIPDASGSARGVVTTGTQTFAGVKTFSSKIVDTRIDPRSITTTSTATLTPDVSADDFFTVTAQAATITLANPTGTPVDGQKIIVRIKDNGTSRTIQYGTEYRGSTDLPLPTATTVSKTVYLGFIYNSADTKWDLIAELDNF